MSSRFGDLFTNNNGFITTLELTEKSFDFILDSIELSIANPESIKCLTEVDNETKTTLAKCYCKILKELVHSTQHKNSNPFVTFFQGSISSFHKLHTSSCKTAICFSIILWKQLKRLVFSGSLCPKKISHNLDEILNNLVDLIKNNKLNYLPRPIEYAPKSKILSRHFYKSKETAYDFIANEEYFKELIRGICRNQIKLSELIWKIIVNLKGVKFDFNNILIMISSSSKCFIKSEINEFNFDIAKGIILKLDADKLCLIERLSRLKCLNALVIDAGLVHDFTHLGFNKKLEFNEFNNYSNTKSKDYKQQWLNEVKSKLVEHDIQCVFVRDQVDKEILQFCELNLILVLHNLSYKLLKMIQNLYKCDSIAYIEDFELGNVFKCKFEKINSSELGNPYLKLESVGLNENDDTIITVIIETRLQSTCDMYKEDLKHCLKRVSNILESGFYVNGNGEIENYISESIMQKLNCSYREEDGQIYYNLTKEAFRMAFRDFYLLILKNDLSTNNSVFSKNTSSRTVDDFQSKIEAWKLACAMNRYFLNSDKAILY